MSSHCGQRPQSLGWYQVYEWTAFNDVATFAYTINNSGTAPTFTRILYQLVFDKYSVWCEMDDFTGNVASKVGVPLTWTYDVAVTNLKIYFSANSVNYPGALSASIYNRSAATGKINFWPSSYSPSTDNTYDDVDTGYSTTNGHGSFQVFDTTTTPHYCVFAWNAWGGTSEVDAIGIGQSTSTHPDWTFTKNRTTVPPKLGRIFVK